MKKVLIFGVLGPSISLIWIVLFLIYLAMKPYGGENVKFEIKSGEAFSKINYRLKEKNLISSPRVFHKMAQYKKVTEKFKPGTYEIKNGMTMSDIMKLFLEGTKDFIKLTIPEGKNIFEIAKMIESKNLDSEENFIAAAKDSTFMKSLGIPGERAEGYLFPDTYSLEPHMKSRDIIKIMFGNFKKRVATLDLEKIKSLKQRGDKGFTLHEVISLASIVEKETGAAFEREIIAGVFHNRLQKNIRLQSDPTTIYGIYENFNGNLRKRHLQEKTPYNTYRINGIPKGPICNPGLEAIAATIQYRSHDYLYFVSKNDGTHVFTTNYKDHLKAVDEWQKNRKNRKGKSWRNLEQKKRANQQTLPQI